MNQTRSAQPISLRVQIPERSRQSPLESAFFVPFMVRVLSVSFFFSCLHRYLQHRTPTHRCYQRTREGVEPPAKLDRHFTSRDRNSSLLYSCPSNLRFRSGRSVASGRLSDIDNRCSLNCPPVCRRIIWIPINLATTHRRESQSCPSHAVPCHALSRQLNVLFAFQIHDRTVLWCRFNFLPSAHDYS